MRTMICGLMIVLLTASPCMAVGCQDTQDAAQTAMKNRNSRANDTVNMLIPDPEEERGWLFDILASVNIFGDGFTLGVTLPSLNQIMGQVCNKAEHAIQDKIREVQRQAISSVPSIGGYNPLKVNGNTDYIRPVTGKLK